MGRCDAYATEFDLEAEEYVPLPKVTHTLSYMSVPWMVNMVCTPMHLCCLAFGVLAVAAADHMHGVGFSHAMWWTVAMPCGRHHHIILSQPQNWLVSLPWFCQ